MRSYILDNNNNAVKSNWLTSSKFCATCSLNRTTKVNGYFISTIFLGEDQRWCGDQNGLPILWETSVFDGFGKSFLRWRADTYARAMDNHKKVIHYIKHNNIEPSYKIFTNN